MTVTSTSLAPQALDQLFRTARTYNQFTERPVSDETLRQLYGLLQWGPTAVNCQAARFVFIRTPEGKARLRPALAPGNKAKADSAPVTAIVAWDRRFFDLLPSQWTAYDARRTFADDPGQAESTAFRNSALGGAYLILAARALGLDCGPMSGFNPAHLDAEFFPDGRFASNFLVNLGYGAPEGCYPRGPRLSFEEAVTLA